MVKEIRYIYSRSTDPYENLALEEYLLHHVERGQCILYLWQNQHTVVIGRNQNSWKECKVEQLEGDGGRLVRRLSGGGAVYHDLGNLNFTFLVREEDYDVQRQLEVILRGIQSWGIEGEKSGRNDITVGGRKCSGNAFYSSGGHCYHHGTLLIDVQMDQLSHYLNVSQEKIRSKGVDSVKARVINLKELAEDMTIAGMSDALITAFEEVYQCPARKMEKEEIDLEQIKTLTEKFSSWEWKHGRKIPFTMVLERRFSWGDISLCFHIQQGIIQEVKGYSDGMDIDLVDQLPKIWAGKSFQKQLMMQELEVVANGDELVAMMIGDIKRLLEEEME